MKKIEFDYENKLNEAQEYFTCSKEIIRVDNQKELDKACGNVYGLYVNGELKYIGERQSDKIIDRLKQHFFKCPIKTHSKLKEIKKERRKHSEVGFKTLYVNPDFFRYSVETYLIQKLNPEWNVRDKNKKKGSKTKS